MVYEYMLHGPKRELIRDAAVKDKACRAPQVPGVRIKGLAAQVVPKEINDVFFRQRIFCSLPRQVDNSLHELR